MQLNFKHGLSVPATKTDLVGNISDWLPWGPMLADVGSVLFACLFCFLDDNHNTTKAICVSCNTSMVAHSRSRSCMKVHFISACLGVGAHSPVPAARAAHCPALLPSTFASTWDFSVSLPTFIMPYFFSIVGWLDREQICILRSSLY